MTPFSSERSHQIEPFHVMSLLGHAKQLEAQGKDIIHLEIGEPDFNTPQPIINAGIQALQAGQTHYTMATGLPELKQAIAQYYLERYEKSVDPARIIITPGASGALFATLAALINPGEQVIVSDPGYPCNVNFIRSLGGVPLAIPLSKETHYQMTREHLTAQWDRCHEPEKIKAALFATPSNPTGTTITREEMEAILRFCDEKQIVPIVDEIYQGLTYDEQQNDYSAVNGQDNLFVINSFSKYFGMTGWRLGWVVVPEWAIPLLDKMNQNLFLAAPTPSQYAALAAFSPETKVIMEAQRKTLEERRDYLFDALCQLGFQISTKPDGAFYLYADISQLLNTRCTNSYDFCINLLNEAGVAITPGIDFGSTNADKHVRIAYTAPINRLKIAIERIRDTLTEI